MKIYIAGGMPIMNVPGREIEMSKLIGKWNRLYSYHYIIASKHITQSFIDIIQINKKKYGN